MHNLRAGPESRLASMTYTCIYRKEPFEAASGEHILQNSMGAMAIIDNRLQRGSNALRQHHRYRASGGVSRIPLIAGVEGRPTRRPEANSSQNHDGQISAAHTWRTGQACEPDLHAQFRESGAISNRDLSEEGSGLGRCTNTRALSRHQHGCAHRRPQRGRARSVSQAP